MSLDSVMLVVEVENTFNISIPSSDGEQIFTIRQLSEYVANKTGQDLEAVEFRIMTILHESLGVEWKLLKPNASLANDLGID